MRIHVKLENLRQNHLEKSQNNAVCEVSPPFSFRGSIRTWTTVPRSNNLDLRTHKSLKINGKYELELKLNPMKF